MIRSILGVLTGIVVGVILVFVGEMVGHHFFPPPPGMDIHKPESMKEHFADLPLGAFVSMLGAWSVGIFVGSWLGAFIARRSPYVHAACVGFVFCAFSLLTMLMIPHPIWFMAAACAALPLATILGGLAAKGMIPRESGKDQPDGLSASQNQDGNS